MRDALFSAFLRLPQFRGRDRLMMLLRDRLYSPRPNHVIRGLQVHLDPMEWSQLDLMRDHQGEEPRTLRLYGELLREGDTYVDVGAYIGFHTLVARQHLGASGFVLAVEPQPYHGERILANWGANGFENIVVQMAAAGPESGFVSLTHQSSIDRSRLSLAGAEGDRTASPLRFRVPILRLEEIFEQHALSGPIRLLKIDVEGFEPGVLEGLGAAAVQVENLIVEVLEAVDLRVGDSLPVLDRLRLLGFTRWRTVEGEAWQPGHPLAENNLWASRVAPSA